MNIRKIIGDVAWVILLGIMTFVSLTALWIRRTYGILSLAVVNESFRNGLQNKRTLFAKHVILPTVVVLGIIIMVHIMYKEMNRRRAACISAFLLMLSVFASLIILDVGSYLSRLYRLSKEQWYDTDHVVVHALGSIDGDAYTNSKEALEHSYQDGTRLFECDLIMTSDGQIVACHDWDFWNRETYQNDSVGEEYIPTLEVFMSCKVMGKYTPMSGDDIVQFLRDYPDTYFITDTKYAEPEQIKEEFQALVDAAERNDCKEVLERFVVQIYHEYMYDIVNEIYPFSNYIYTLYTEGYRGEADKMQQYAEFCMLHDIDVITMNANYYQNELSDICEQYGIHMFVHTVNDRDEIYAFHERGIGVYTDISRSIIYE